MRSSSERDITFFDCVVQATPNYCARLGMAEIGTRIANIFETPGAVWWSKDKRRKIFLRSVEQDKTANALWLLLYSNNADGSGASFAHLSTDVQRDEEKVNGEGRPESAHVVIWLDETKMNSGRYLMLLEGANTMSRQRVEAFLNRLLRQLTIVDPDRFKHPNPDGSADKSGHPNMVRFNLSIDLRGHLSDDFMRDLEAGKLNGITLETNSLEKKPTGESSYFSVRQNNLLLSPKKTWKDDKFAIVKDALRVGKSIKYERARVVFQTPDNMGHTALLDTETGVTLNDGYIKKIRVAHTNNGWKEAATTFDEDIRSSMRALLPGVTPPNSP